MSTYTAQQLLDQLHASGFNDLFEPTLAEKVYRAKLKLFRQVLRGVKKSLKAEQAEVKARWNGRVAIEARQEKIELLPFTILEMLIDKIEIAVSELEVAITSGQPPPDAITFGDMIAVDFDGSAYTAELVNRAAYTQAKLEREERERVAVEAKDQERQRAQQEEGEYQQAMWRRVTEQQQVMTTHADVGDMLIKDADTRSTRLNLEQAKDLINKHKYAEARAILENVDHPKAREWLAKLNTKHSGKSRLGPAILLLIVALIGVLLTFAVKAQNDAARLNAQFLSYDANSTWTPEYFTVTPAPTVAARIVLPTAAPTRYIPPTAYQSFPSTGGIFGGGSTCADGTHSSSTGRGTCSHHGGVR